MDINFKTVSGSAKSAHQAVTVDEALAGEVWPEQVNVEVSKLTEPRRTALKWRCRGIEGMSGMSRAIFEIWREQSAATQIALLNIHLVVVFATTVALLR